MRSPWLVLSALLVVANGCRSHRGPQVPQDTGVDPNFRIPEVHPPGTPSQNGTELDVPLSWLFVSESPAITGSAPNVVVGGVMPCGFRAVFGTVSPPAAALHVRIHAVYAGQGDPRAEHCETQPAFVQIVSLQRLRLGEYAVSDALPARGDAGVLPSAALRVVADDSNAPSPMARRVRRCVAGDDSTCTGGGVCATIPDHDVGVCVPPIDPYLFISRPCPDGRVDVTLAHAPMTMGPAPREGSIRACLPPCDDAHSCDAGFECIASGEQRVCIPQGGASQ